MTAEILMQVYPQAGGFDVDLSFNVHDGTYMNVDVLMLAQRIRNLRTICRDHDLCHASIWCYQPPWDSLVCDGMQVRSDVEQLHVTKDEFWFDCYIKHSTIKLSTEHVNVSQLKAMGI